MGRRADKLEGTAGIIRGADGECLVLPCDVSQEDQVAQAVSAAAEAWAGLDVLVAVAGIELWGRGDTKVHELELACWQEIIDIN